MISPELKSLSSTLSEEETNNKENSKCHNKKKLGRSHDPRQAALHSCCPKEDEMEHVMVIFLYLVVLHLHAFHSNVEHLYQAGASGE